MHISLQVNVTLADVGRRESVGLLQGEEPKQSGAVARLRRDLQGTGKHGGKALLREAQKRIVY